MRRREGEREQRRLWWAILEGGWGGGGGGGGGEAEAWAHTGEDLKRFSSLPLSFSSLSCFLFCPPSLLR